jgi:GntR family transcriptional regulator
MYAQIADWIVTDVQNGRFSAGDYLPSEILLSKELKVSRSTVTKAYDFLQEKRVVQRVRGAGTQVAPPIMEREIIDFTGFSQHVREQGRRPGSRLLKYQTEFSGSSQEDISCAYPLGTELIVIERLRLVDGEPRGIQRLAIRSELAKEARITQLRVEDPDFSLYKALSDANIILKNAEETLVASIATEEESTIMGIPKNTSIMEVFRKSFDQSGQMIEAVRARYLGNAYLYKVRLGVAQAN